MTTPIVKKIVHDGGPYDHWDCIPLRGYIYENLLEEKLLDQLYKSVVNILSQQAITYKTHGTTFSFKNSNYSIVKHDQNARYQQVAYDLSFEKEWEEQTSDTIKEWSDNYLKNNINPVFYKFLQVMYDQPPFNENPENWIPYRWHLNVLEYDNFLGLHTDGSSKLYVESKSNSISLTFYLEEYQEGWGGELYTFDGFVYKPIKNSAIGFNGAEVMHGVRGNLKPDKKPRIAFTTRWAPATDLYFPKEHEHMRFFERG